MVKPDETKRAADDKSFDELLGELSLRLLKASPGKTDSEIRQSLEEIGEHYRVDRVELRRFEDDCSATTLLHWWVRSDEIGVSAYLPNDQLPWATSLILRGEVVRIGRLSDMPAEAASGRALLERDGLRAAMLIPLEVSDQFVGSLVLASQEERDWSDEVVRESKFLGEAVAIAYTREQLYNSLWTSESRLRAVVDNQTEFIIRWLPDGTQTWVNDRYCEYIQESRESMIGTGFLPLIAPSDRQKILNKIEAMTPDDPTQTGDHRVLLPSGETRWQSWTDTGLFDDSGKLIEIQSIGRDITDRKRAQEALLESESRYRNLIENTADSIWEMNLDLVPTYSNNQLEVILGYTTDELRKLSLKQLFHPEDLLAIQERLPGLIDRKSGWEQWMLRFRHKNGSYRHLASNASPVLDADGNVCGFRGIDRDITDSVMSRDIIEKSEQKYRTVVESANDAIFLMDDGRFSDCNNKTLEIYQRERKDLIGKTPWDMSPQYQPDGSTSKDLAMAILKDVNSGNPRRFDWVHLRPDGTTIDMEISLTPIELTDDGSRLLAVARDVTDTKRAQREIEHRANFQARLATLSTDLMRCRNDEVIERCRSALESIGKEYEFDTAAIWWYSNDGETINRIVAWHRKGIQFEVPPDSLRLTNFSWSKPLLLAGKAIKIDNVDELPAKAREDRELLQNIGYKALLAIPAPHVDEPWGTCTCIFAMLKPRTWPDQTVQELQLLGETLSNALTRYMAMKEISHRAKFQHRLAELSTSLATALPEEADERLNQACGRIGVQYELDSVGLWWYSGDKGEVVDRQAGWRRAQDTWPVPSEHEERTYVPWFANNIREGKTVQIDDVGDMPDEAHTDQASMQRWGISSLLGIPARVKDKIAGCCIFISSEQRNWQEETVQELQLIADTLSGAYTCRWATAEAVLSERDLARSQKLARIGSYSLLFETPQASFSLKGRIKLSAQFRELYGIEAGQESTELVLSRFHPDDYERVVHAMEKGFMSGAPMRETYRVVRPDGTVLHLEGQHETDRNEKGYVNRIFGTAQDVTEHVESTKKIEIALAEIEKLKDQLQEENLYLREEIRAAHGFDKIIGNSPKLNNALKSVEKVAPTDVTVMILGETGTGKELIAQAIHDLSGRKDSALISVNCAALSKDLIESELFGHEKGAFTGAHSQRKGRFELADGGTLFLDEIGELPGELQAKLLRVLQTGDFERLGGSETLHVDARLITATNRNIKRAVDEGEFRADLYYRISSFPIELPPLRERPEDIPALAEFLVRKYAKRMGKDIQSISARTIRYITNQKWPGNVRELEGFIQRALISAIGPVLDYSESYDSEPESSASSDSVPAGESADLRNVEHQHILKVLKRARWVIDGKRGAASMMGVAPSTLRSKMKRLGISRPVPKDTDGD